MFFCILLDIGLVYTIEYQKESAVDWRRLLNFVFLFRPRAHKQQNKHRQRYNVSFSCRVLKFSLIFLLKTWGAWTFSHSWTNKEKVRMFFLLLLALVIPAGGRNSSESVYNTCIFLPVHYYRQWSTRNNPSVHLILTNLRTSLNVCAQFSETNVELSQ